MQGARGRRTVEAGPSEDRETRVTDDDPTPDRTVSPFMTEAAFRSLHAELRRRASTDRKSVV